MKNKIVALLCIVSLIMLSGCLSSSNSGTASNIAVTGSAVKGPYQPGATVNVYQLINGARSASPVATGTVTDVVGHYNVGIPSGVNGPFEIVVSGQYIDEVSGNVTTSSQETSLVLADSNNIPAKLNLNPIASIQAALVKKALVSNPAADVAQEIQSAGTLALQALNIPGTDAAGNAIDPTQIDIFDPAADPDVTAAVIVASAIISDVAGTSGGTVSVASFAADAATDIVSGKALGTTGGTATAIAASTSAVANTDVVANINNALIAAAAAAGTAPAESTVSTTSSTTTNAASNAATLTAIKGFALAGNTFTIGGISANVDATGTVSTINNVDKNNVSVSMTFKDYGTGSAPLTQTLSTSLDFDITDQGSSRAISGTINPVNIIADGNGVITVKVPANATLTFSGTTSAGTSVTGTATNTALDTVFFTDAAGVTTIDGNALLTKIQNKVNDPALNVLNTAGTFDYAFGVGINIGLENTAGNGIASLFPAANTKVSGRAIIGTITTF